MKKILMVVIDGFGISDDSKGNAIKNAAMPNYRTLLSNYSHSELEASGKSIGLYKNRISNSEIGHMIIGAGRIIKDNYMKVEDIFKNNELKNNDVFKSLVNYVNEYEKTLHIFSVCSNDYNKNIILKLIDKLHVEHVNNINLHLILKDNNNLYNNINEISNRLDEYRMGSIVSLCGKCYAMDTNNNWNKIKYYTDLLTNGTGIHNSIKEYLDDCYNKGISNDNIPPLLIKENSIINNDDTLFFLNYNNSDYNELLNALTNINFNYYDTKHFDNLKIFSMFEISNHLNISYLCSKDTISNSFGAYIDDLGLTQARVADVSKYIDISYFFDGLRNLKLENCDYYVKPNMSLTDITCQTIKCIEKDYDFILANYSSIDNLCHNGGYEATIKELESFDKCLDKLYQFSNDNFYTMFIIGTYGNAEYMLDSNNNRIVDKSFNPVPFIITDNNINLIDGNLSQVAPTVLKYMDISIPKEMNESGDLYYKEDNLY